MRSSRIAELTLHASPSLATLPSLDEVAVEEILRRAVRSVTLKPMDVMASGPSRSALQEMCGHWLQHRQGAMPDEVLSQMASMRPGVERRGALLMSYIGHLAWAHPDHAEHFWLEVEGAFGAELAQRTRGVIEGSAP